MKLWLFSHRCPLCDRRASTYLCAGCAAAIEQCRRHPQSPVEICASVRVHVWGSYAGALRRALEVLKYKQRPELGDWLGERLGRWWLNQDKPPLAFQVVAVPLHPSRQAQRGYNQADRIARAFCQRTGFVYRPHGLRRIVATPALHGLDPERRARALEQAFAVGTAPAVRPVLLVDDICTTGSTLARCAAALLKAGSGAVEAAVIARPALDRRPRADA
ncbi:ComF family protein [Gloeobacter morelensis]|uniref:ComF family protein n=1 Tax=Gloeobacter morelensis MG652769 TaxID=2781736 RepID=A0ABY3PQJ8_9CYAN|nr:ComF family protein [Gloeobacter morelensis]UFP95990.1 ComF family protein [Gloeobacter morelensis MG652769]